MIPNVATPTTFTDATGRKMVISIRPAENTGVDPKKIDLTEPLDLVDRSWRQAVGDMQKEMDAQIISALEAELPPAVPIPEGIVTQDLNSLPDSPSFTIFVLCYGEFPDMHRRCLASVSRTTFAKDVEIRVFCNALGPQSKEVVNPLVTSRATRVYRSEKNLLKYPAMRTMFHDPTMPIRSDWIVWLDDDSMCDVNPNWLAGLRQVIASARTRDPNVALVGDIRRTDLPNVKYANWLRKGRWHRGRPTRGKQIAVPSPNGASVHFVSGGCWAMRTDMIEKADIPDIRLEHNGGDICIGEQVYQAGGTMVIWNHNKQQVVTSSVPRRGVNQGVLHWVDK